MLLYEYFYQKWVYSTWDKTFAGQSWCDDTKLWVIMFDDEAVAIEYTRSN
jgi:hypothetical protein